MPLNLKIGRSVGQVKIKDVQIYTPDFYLVEYGFHLENLDNFPRILPSQDDQQQALRFELIARHLDVWGNFFSRSTAEFDIIVPPSLQFEGYEYPSEAQMDQGSMLVKAKK